MAEPFLTFPVRGQKISFTFDEIQAAEGRRRIARFLIDNPPAETEFETYARVMRGLATVYESTDIEIYEVAQRLHPTRDGAKAIDQLAAAAHDGPASPEAIKQRDWRRNTFMARIAKRRPRKPRFGF